MKYIEYHGTPFYPCQFWSLIRTLIREGYRLQIEIVNHGFKSNPIPCISITVSKVPHNNATQFERVTFAYARTHWSALVQVTQHLILREQAVKEMLSHGHEIPDR